MFKKPGSIQILIGMSLLLFTAVTFTIIQFFVAFIMIFAGVIILISAFFHRNLITNQYNPSWFQLILGLTLLIVGLNWWREPESFINAVQFFLGFYLIFHAITLFSIAKIGKAIESVNHIKINGFHRNLINFIAISNLILAYLVWFASNNRLIVIALAFILISQGIKKVTNSFHNNNHNFQNFQEFKEINQDEINEEINRFREKYKQEHPNDNNN